MLWSALVAIWIAGGFLTIRQASLTLNFKSQQKRLCSHLHSVWLNWLQMFELSEGHELPTDTEKMNVSKTNHIPLYFNRFIESMLPTISCAKSWRHLFIMVQSSRLWIMNMNCDSHDVRFNVNSHFQKIYFLSSLLAMCLSCHSSALLFLQFALNVMRKK